MASPDRPPINPPHIKGLGITQEGSPTRWRATGYVEGLGWLEDWGTSLITALETLQTLAAQRVAEQEAEAELHGRDSNTMGEG